MMTIYRKTIKGIFEAIHDKDNKRFHNQFVLLTHDDENYTCALTDETVRYGTDNYLLFEQSVKNDFSDAEANQILTYEIQLIESEYYFSALDTTIPYFVDEKKTQKKILHISAYPKDEFEETKAYKSRCPLSGFKF